MNFTHYLPNTEQRIENLRRIINGRTVAIMVHGYSATELEDRITEIEDCDICYASLSAFWLSERYITRKIGRTLTVAQCTPIPGLNLEMNNVRKFLERQEDNIFITAAPSLRQADMPEWFNLDEFVAKYNDKLLVYDAIWAPHELFHQAPTTEYPLHFAAIGSLTMLISLIIIGKASRIILFGADGGRINPDHFYYRQLELDYKQISSATEGAMISDTKNFNAAMPGILGRVSQIYNLLLPDIVNCSKDSHYTTFRKLSYDETFELLKGQNT